MQINFKLYDIEKPCGNKLAKQVNNNELVKGKKRQAPSLY